MLGMSQVFPACVDHDRPFHLRFLSPPFDHACGRTTSMRGTGSDFMKRRRTIKTRIPGVQVGVR
ncbi:MAG: hypothetical protein CVU57_23510 [Deltaproteobacteria bacterium HGW-Deltaproteobacteria-15]|nr:MAG: hypothetical protein CVU57_23510 [Deltaproteobacteria bacterium HGW-Deltaproteobacteria-15]